MSDGKISAPVSGPSVPVQTLHDVFGTLLVGTWVNCMMFMLEVVLIVRYFERFSSDRLWIRVLVVSMFVIDIAGTCAFCALGYTYVVSGWGDAVAMQIQNLNFPIWVATSGVVILMMHTFLIRRYFVLTSNWFVTVVLYIPACTAFVGAMLVTWALSSRYTTAADRPKQKTYVTLWLVGAVAADAMIALALILELGRVKSSFKNTQSLVTRLIRTSAMSGLFPALLAITALIIFLSRPDTNHSLIFSGPIPRVCTCTVLFNLCQRGQGNGASSGGTSIPMDTAKQPGETRIGVHQISVVHVDHPAGSRMDRSETDFETASFSKGRGDIV